MLKSLKNSKGPAQEQSPPVEAALAALLVQLKIQAEKHLMTQPHLEMQAHGALPDDQLGHDNLTEPYNYTTIS